MQSVTIIEQLLILILYIIIWLNAIKFSSYFSELLWALKNIIT